MNQLDVATKPVVYMDMQTNIYIATKGNTCMVLPYIHTVINTWCHLVLMRTLSHVFLMQACVSSVPTTSPNFSLVDHLVSH